MTRKPPHAKLQTPDPGAVRWTEGFWADRFNLAIDTIIPSMHEAMHTPEANAKRAASMRGHRPTAKTLEALAKGRKRLAAKRSKQDDGRADQTIEQALGDLEKGLDILAPARRSSPGEPRS